MIEYIILLIQVLFNYWKILNKSLIYFDNLIQNIEYINQFFFSDTSQG